MTDTNEQVKHTAGEWSARQRLSGSENHKGWQIMSDGGPIGEIYPLTEDGSPEARGNARIIPNSPKMYKALRELITWSLAHSDWRAAGKEEPPDHPISIARAAIADVEGK